MHIIYAIACCTSYVSPLHLIEGKGMYTIYYSTTVNYITVMYTIYYSTTVNYITVYYSTTVNYKGSKTQGVGHHPRGRSYSKG